MTDLQINIGLYIFLVVCELFLLLVNKHTEVSLRELNISDDPDEPLLLLFEASDLLFCGLSSGLVFSSPLEELVFSLLNALFRLVELCLLCGFKFS